MRRPKCSCGGLQTSARGIAIIGALPTLIGPVTAKLCELATALQFARIVKSAPVIFQQNQALRYHPPRIPSGEMSKEAISARSTAARKLLISLGFYANGHSAQLRGHWAKQAA